ncbi:lysine--tRNA ligase [Candidatus Oleimmundimicrobium sp.]|uniref:lysine--tRNA ligase n=1 Tax=Candidatus Oleimmundimicrobium sp. TaxID=3060597 RepID=UPI00271F4CF7|nr:lysine--tRNA ligase [Candidatus Oleimmundimicrobium sp.]MDO8885987.1 lysine--tRNA ligase [Candidatus Oleimmundimicrobium sp.]
MEDNELELNELMIQRRYKLQELVSSNINPYKGKFEQKNYISEIISTHKNLQPGENTDNRVIVAGRIMALRKHGKASFAVISDVSGKIQLYLSIDKLGEKAYHFSTDSDIGDWVGISGLVFKTHRGELSIAVDKFELLSKSLRPFPEKWHGLKDVEIRHRQRYVDLIVNSGVKELFIKRNKIIKFIRNFLDEKGFLEVETPMLQSIPGGATARPFTTHHNALDIDLYLRIAPELYLKRLIVGGLERVYELNRNFRNEGMSAKHNPEFTMLEIYQAYADYNDMIKFTQELISSVVKELCDSTIIEYEDNKLDFSDGWREYTMLEAIEKFAGIKLSFEMEIGELKAIAKQHQVAIKDNFGKGKIITEIFDKLIEGQLIQPTFIKDYPIEVTPLAKQHPDNPNLTERFELIIAGREIANAFSELINPLEQRKRFEQQLDENDEEAQRIDEDFLRALEYGMPPTGGLGIGIDRLIMLLTNSHSIQEVILFPQMKPES